MHILQDVYVYIHSVLCNVPFRAAVCHEVPLSMGILQAKTLKWIALPSSRGSQPRDQTQVSHIAGRLFTIWATWEGLGHPVPAQ